MSAETDPLVSQIADALMATMRLMVDNPEAVTIVPSVNGSTFLFTVRTIHSDAAKLIGKQGRTARSLRMILGGMGMTHGRRFALDIDTEDAR